jgi:hypothetical protein
MKVWQIPSGMLTIFHNISQKKFEEHLYDNEYTSIINIYFYETFSTFQTLERLHSKTF